MSNIKRQKTLGVFKFTKTVNHRGAELNIEIPDHVAMDDSKRVSCNICKKRFANAQGWGHTNLAARRSFLSHQHHLLLQP